MNTKVIAATIIILLLVGGGFYFMSKSKLASQQQTATGQPTAAQQNTIFSSIKDALARSLSLQCTFTDQSGRQTTSYIKNGAIRADIVGQDPKQSGSVIVKGNTMYYWNGKTGFMMAIPTGEAVNVTPGASSMTAQGMIATMEKYKSNCKPATVADSLFTPPSDISFQDMSKMMKQMQTTGTMMPSGYQQQMQQYQQRSTSQGY